MTYTTREGDRLDLLAYRHLGTPAAYRELLAANPQAPIVAILPPGLTLQIPASDTRRRRGTR